MTELINQAVTLTGLNKLDTLPSLQWVEAKTKVKPSLITLGISALLFILLAIFSLDTLVLCSVGYIVPAYFTYLAMESHNREGQIRYLVYWAAFSLSEILNPVGIFLIGSHLWVIARVGLVVALLNPKIDGAYKLYKMFLQPLAQQLPESAPTKKEETSATPAQPVQSKKLI